MPYRAVIEKAISPLKAASETRYLTSGPRVFPVACFLCDTRIETGTRQLQYKSSVARFKGTPAASALKNHYGSTYDHRRILRAELPE
jgi:hypothetical protein